MFKNRKEKKEKKVIEKRLEAAHRFHVNLKHDGDASLCTPECHFWPIIHGEK